MDGYQDYFKKRRQLDRKTGKSPTGKQGRRKKRLGSSSIWMIIVATTLAGGSIWYLCGGEQVATDFVGRMEVSILGQAEAGEASSNAEKTADGKLKEEAKSAGETATTPAISKASQKSWTDEEITLFKKLDSRKKELDAKEADLSKLEEELQKQKGEIEAKLASLEDVRTKIANKLEDKVKIDNQKVETLVSVYANMKPATAAKVIETLNEDLAVEILAKMKNKSAAEILNSMSAEKAKKISERFAGFREPALAGN